jgi:hypothetical protein
MVKFLCYFYSLSGISLIAQSFVTFFPRQYTDFKKQIQKLETQVSENKTRYLRGCFKSPILCHAERSVSPPDDLRYAKRVLSISVYVQNPRFFLLLRSTQNDKLYPVRLFKHSLIRYLVFNPKSKI